jgi:hypothetical protein
METVLAVMGVIYAALCIWLTVRIVNRRERWARRTLAGLLVGTPVLYVAGFGPAIWLTKLDDPWAPRTAAIYWPLGRAVVDAPEVIGEPLAWYAGLFAQPWTDFGCADVYCVPVGPGDRWNFGRNRRHE